MLKPIDWTPYYNLTGRRQAVRAAVSMTTFILLLPLIVGIETLLKRVV